MSISDSVNAILHHKGTDVYTVAPTLTVFEAIQLMADRNVGALVVTAGGKVTGIITERDYTRKVALKGKSSKETFVSELLSEPVIFVTPDHSVEDCMRLMVHHRVRHLPVMEGERLAGVWYSSSGVPTCCTMPPFSTTMRSASVSASTWSWVT